MRVTNYFKVGRRPFFFDDRRSSSIEVAWSGATAYAARFPLGEVTVCAWLPCAAPGPWASAPIIGEPMVVAESRIVGPFGDLIANR